MNRTKTAVIGAGASGLIASYFAAENNDVVLFEKQKKIGRKILITGNGRCNISNRNITPDRYHGENPSFVKEIFFKFSTIETEAFFSSIGIPLIEEKEGKLFPASLQASIVPKVFEYVLKKRGVDIRLHRKVEKIIPEQGRFRIITAGNEEELYDSVILACGSKAFPSSGASDSGYELAESLKHKIIEPFPAILPINIPFKPLHTLQGIKLDCGVKVYLNGKLNAESFDELLFTSYGISGPASLKISRVVNSLVLTGKTPDISIDLFPVHDRDSLRYILRSVLSDPGRKLAFALLGILKERIPDVLLPLSGIDPNGRCGDLSDDEFEKLLSMLKDLVVKPGRPRSFSEAVAAAGGVSVEEINPYTMESKIHKKLFITGELLDIDGDSGGFNLQFAWSTGAIAGKNA